MNSAVVAVSLLSFLAIAAICVCGRAEATLRGGTISPSLTKEDLNPTEARLVKFFRELMPEDQQETLQFMDWLIRSETPDRRRIR